MYRDRADRGAPAAGDRGRGPGGAGARPVGRRTPARSVDGVRRPLTRRGWCFLAVGVAVLLAAQLLGRRDLLSLGVFLLLLPVAGLLYLRWSRPVLSARRWFEPEQAEVGRPVRVHLAVDGTVHGVRALAQEDVDPALGAPLRFRVPDPGQAPATGRTGGTGRGQPVHSRYRYELHPTRRGVYTAGPLRLRRQDPFGMTARHVLTGDADPVLVRPRLVDLRGGQEEGWRDARGLVPAVRTTAHTDVDVSTRDYHPGDPIRRVHWPASARHGKLMVRQELSTTTPPAVLLIDDRIGAHLSRTGAAFAPAPGSGELVTSDGFELLVSLGLSVAAELSRVGADVVVRSADGRPLLETSPTAIDPAQDVFSRSTGVADLAVGLAGLSLREAARRNRDDDRRSRRPSRPERAADGAGPGRHGHRVFEPSVLGGLSHDVPDGDLFVFAGELTDTETTRLAALAGTVAAAHVVLVVPRPDAAGRTLNRLRDAGWAALAVDRHETVRSVWDAWAHQRASRPVRQYRAVPPGTLAPSAVAPANGPTGSGPGR
ncbi:membrane protein [Tersicoccus solisilvae]|uniref:Membrane protein n=1 Tax=Tersicoccus solisilvae TaxID=1882339 RepID=A0ABQ1PAW8_9MICC|nr:DUF58 domain-containing protein [Tersicoccus solisilvae]GGC92834.1 membrane protein [Tersicoccus solisilvae]